MNEIVNSVEGSQVGTVTLHKIDPISANVIPGRVDLVLELRSVDTIIIYSIFEKIEQYAKKITKTIVPGKRKKNKIIFFFFLI